MLSRARFLFGTGLASTQFYTLGRLNFTKTGYIKHTQKYESPVQSRADVAMDDESSDGVNLEGKIIVVTGANQGIGKELATYCAAKQAKIYMVCRTRERAEKARDEIMKATSNTNVHVLLADVGELSQVKSVVEDLQSRESSIDCLVCNAGALLSEKRLTQDGGREVTFASHLLGGSYYLTKLLTPQLKSAVDEGKEPKVIFVTSAGMYTTKFPHWKDATNTAEGQKYDGVMAYAYAKRAQVILAEEWAKNNDGVTYLTAHPGWSGTQALEDWLADDQKYLQPLRTAWEGAEGISWMIGSPKNQLQNGALYLDRKVQKKHIAGLFMTEGTFTKNTGDEINELLENLKKECGI